MEIVYIPVLKLRSSEMTALKFLDKSLKEKTMPVIQLLSDTNLERKNNYFEAKIKELLGAFWGSKMPFYADFDLVYKEDKQMIGKFLSRIMEYDLNFTPVLGLFNPDPDYLDLVREKYLQNGVCLKFDEYRFRNNTIPDFSIHLNEVLTNCIKFFSIDESQIDLYLNLNVIDINDFPLLPQNLMEVIFNIKNGKRVRRIFVSAGSFPKDLGEIKADTIRPLYRHELDLWRNLKILKDENYNLIYSDYGNIHPIYDNSQQSYSGSCSIKYTGEEDYYIYRGSKPDKHKDGSGQYITKSKLLIDSVNFDGPDFSWGDNKIFEVSKNKVSTGNASKWVQYTLNHHITKIHQLMS